MCFKLEDIYTDYLICQTKHATATGLSAMLPEELSHDQITRFLNGEIRDSKSLWSEVKSDVRKQETEDDGVLLIDDMPAEKPYTDENDIIAWHYSHAKGRVIKGIDLLSCLVRYGDVSFPISYEVIKKDLKYSDLKTKREKRKSSITKNEHFRQLLAQAGKNNVKFKHILADSWFSSKENMKYIQTILLKYFIMGIKTNRSVAMTKDDKLSGRYQRLDSTELEDGVSQQVYLKDIGFAVQLLKKIFKNEDGSTGTLYLVTNDIEIDGEQILQLYKKRWRIEEYHKSVKQNASFEKSPTKTVKSQLNHIYCSIVAYCKLERLKLKCGLNHFAIKYKLIVRANQIALQELQKMTC